MCPRMEVCIDLSWTENNDVRSFLAATLRFCLARYLHTMHPSGKTQHSWL